MLNSLNTGVSGLQQFQSQIDLIGNNIANVNTTGYKSARLNFADTFGEAMVSGSGGNVASQFGNGVVSAGVTTSYAGGGITETGHGSDLAIENGKGFFIVKNAANEESFATRAGNFREDNQGYLVNSQGYRVQGALGDGNGGEGDLLFRDDPSIRGGFDPGNAGFVGAEVTMDGRILMHFDDQRSYQGGQILLQSFAAPQELNKLGGNLYSNLEAATPVNDAGQAFGSAPGSGHVGHIRSRALETSNVDLTGEFSSLIMAQRAFQANARMISTSDQLLQELVNLPR
jgi:flagellar hook protein FlgE